MSEVNPYASPQERLPDGAPEPPVVAQLATSGPPVGLWRDGRRLVMHKQARLPDRCVKSNQPTDGKRLRRRMYWHHPLIYLSILAGLLIYVILALVLRESATVYIGLSRPWWARRWRAIAIGWLAVLAAVVMLFLGIALAPNSEVALWLLALSFLVFFVGGIYGVVASRMVAPTRITRNYVWLKGVHPDFLADLPAWPGGY
jgi:hypothetical protein